jgi:chemotaxis protein methyltransferase CheR
MDEKMLSTNRLADMERLRQLVEAETGMDLAGSRFPRLQGAVERVLGQQPGANLERILARSEEYPAFLESLTAELTVGESFFFRNEHHFKALREQVFPEIMRENAAQREIRVWSAGCATGEEPYSVAILLDQLLADRGQWQVAILGTDLNLAFQERARQAQYRQWSFRQTDIHQDRRYFSPDGEWFVLSPKVRGHVRFAYLNLVKDVYPSPLTGTVGLDLILFRNVAIYLKPEITQAIIERFRRALRPGGWLLLGEVELSLTPTAGLEAKQFGQATFFRKPLEASGESVLPGPAVVPPLTAVLAPGSPTAPLVPTLPEWGPLPWTGPGSRGTAPARTLTPPEAPFWEQVERCMAHKDFAGAQLVLTRISSAKERAKNRLRYVGLLLGFAELGRAREMLEICLREEPLLIEAQLWKASFAEEAGDLAAAEQAYRRALYIDRHCPMAHFHLALVLQQKGNQAGAHRSLHTTLELIRGKDPHALVEYGEGICYGRLHEMATLMTRGSSADTGKTHRTD